MLYIILTVLLIVSVGVSVYQYQEKQEMVEYIDMLEGHLDHLKLHIMGLQDRVNSIKEPKTKKVVKGKATKKVTK